MPSCLDARSQPIDGWFNSIFLAFRQAQRQKRNRPSASPIGSGYDRRSAGSDNQWNNRRSYDSDMQPQQDRGRRERQSYGGYGQFVMRMVWSCMTCIL